MGLERDTVTLKARKEVINHNRDEVGRHTAFSW